eukprot:m.81976 g.81976  ORF g.81976 m.81976 type:complete len:841 (+) comp12845_c0_seq2:72-2594(+)
MVTLIHSFLLALVFRLSTADPIKIECSAKDSALSRAYDGIGGLSNSCAPWLRSYPKQQLSDILDILYKPKMAASLHVIKIEIGGDGHSTINTEASHMPNDDHVVHSNRGWELWMASEAKKRNPNVRVVSLPWTFPYWVPQGMGPERINYFTSFIKMAKSVWNVTVDYVGLQNEAGDPDSQDVINLRNGLDAAGLQHVLIQTPETHDFNMAPRFADVNSTFVKSVGVIGEHEPLRTREDLPIEYEQSGKPIWSSEAYTTYSDSNGGGCWARAINWGWVKGNVTAHIAWNLIQSYPSFGSGMNYNGHGLMWAEVPWSGHYVVNSPIWVSAHYTHFTEIGWKFLPVGQGSGELAQGGTFVTLVSPDGNDFTTVIQTMAWNMSRCYKDTHPEFTVAPSQNITFQVSQCSGLKEGMHLQVRRTLLLENDLIDPIYNFTANNVYFEKLSDIIVDASLSFTIEMEINTIVTITSLSGNETTPLPDIPQSTPFPSTYQDTMMNISVGQGSRYQIDQEGVFEAAMSNILPGVTTIQMVTQAACEKWHNFNSLCPYTFVGPAVWASTVQVNVAPPSQSDTFAGISVGPQLTSKNIKQVFTVNTTGHWSISGKTGSVAMAKYYQLKLNVAESGSYQAYVNSAMVAEGDFDSQNNDGSWFPTLVASYCGKGTCAEFWNLTLVSNVTTIPPVKPPSPPPSPPPPGPAPPTPPKGSGLALAACDSSDPRQQWVFTGEDKGEAGYLKALADPTKCVNPLGPKTPVVPVSCQQESSGLLWNWNSTSGQFSSVNKGSCREPTKSGQQCNMCLDVMMKNNHIDLFDCEPDHSNQEWKYNEAQGAGVIQYRRNLCLGEY